jgi:hypothetical protein
MYQGGGVRMGMANQNNKESRHIIILVHPLKITSLHLLWSYRIA